MHANQKGQSLLELIVVIAVGILVVGALVFATISSLRNAQFAKNQSQATKLAQEGIEGVRGIRDRDDGVRFNYAGGSTTKFSDLWNIRMSNSCSPCYFNLDSNQRSLTGVAATNFESLGENFSRQIIITEDENYAVEKKIEVIVRWTDFSGFHDSKLTTILRKL